MLLPQNELNFLKNAKFCFLAVFLFVLGAFHSEKFRFKCILNYAYARSDWGWKIGWLGCIFQVMSITGRDLIELQPLKVSVPRSYSGPPVTKWISIHGSLLDCCSYSDSDQVSLGHRARL